MNPLPDFVGAMKGILGAEPDEPITETEIARDRKASEELRRRLAARSESPEAGVRAA